MRKCVPFLSMLLLAISVNGTVWAQQGTQAPPPAYQAPQQSQLSKSSDISDADVANFAKAQQKIQHITAKYHQKIKEAAAKDPSKAADIQQKVQQKMVEAVRNSGMEVDKFNQIAQISQYDEDLRKRIQKEM